MFLYHNKIPNIDDIVIFKVTEINNLNVIGVLPDFNNYSAAINFSELSKKKKFNVKRIVQVNTNFVTQVIDVNLDTNLAELSIKVLNQSEINDFNSKHKKYIALYNLWRYIFMKLNPSINMQIENIDDNLLTNFLNNTLWFYESYYINNFDDFNLDNFSQNLFNKDLNLSLLQLIDPNSNINLTLVKHIIDDYYSSKFCTSKNTLSKNFIMFSYEKNGLSDIQNILDIQSFNKFIDFDNFDITFSFLTNSNYSLTIKQKNVDFNDIDSVYNILIDNITIRCVDKNVYFNIQ